MNPDQRFSILTFPQHFDGATLRVNVLLLPRNQNPLKSAIDGVPALAGAAAFADGRPTFVARIVSGLAGLPGASVPLAPRTLPIARPVDPRAAFTALAGQFAIVNVDAANTAANVAAASPPKKGLPVERSVLKYLPHSYRNAFNFVAPRTRNARTDDSYHCAVRNAAPDPSFQRSTDSIAWGQVFATALRQPLLATALGMIYETRLDIDVADFPHGGWLWVDLDADSDWRAQQDVDPTFVMRYAARIPVLEPNRPRNVFGAIQFPVAPVTPPGRYDDLFHEAADYDDGFAKVVHAFQPVSNSLLLEESDGFHPTRDVGIRLGWDDEQLLIWYIRQLAEDPGIGGGQRIDAPIGTFGYCIDVRNEGPAPGPWQSLNRVRARQALTIVDPATQQALPLGAFIDRELPFQVYPSQLDGDRSKSYWLPMYFAAWTGGSMVLPDDTASLLYRHAEVSANLDARTRVTGPPANRLNELYEASGITTTLRYGDEYGFRIRLGDLTGGGPRVDDAPTDETASQSTRCRFLRHVAPDRLRIDGLRADGGTLLFGDTQVVIQRPLLGYPSVVYTGRYADPVGLLLASSQTSEEAFGIADPDVVAVEIVVEIEALKMDNALSLSGTESYAVLYRTVRTFPAASTTFDDTLVVPLDYRDCKVLRFGDPGDLGDLGLRQAQIDGLDALVLPRARSIRLTLRAVCDDKPAYYGLERADHAFNTRYGRTTSICVRADALDDETGLLGAGRRVHGIFLQPDPPALFDGDAATLLLGKEVDRAPDMVQRLAARLGVEARGLSLVAKKGQRVQFGCSQRIRHTLSPNNATLTFAGKGDLARHWLNAIVLDLARDWTWDGLDDRSFVIERSKRFTDDVPAETETIEVGDLEVRRTAPFNALVDADRTHTTLIFIDAVEPKDERLQPAPHATEPRFPDTIEVAYTIRPAYRNPLGAATDADYALSLALPITTPPAQMPKLVSAGLALSPYVSRNDYSETDPRRRFLWLEFAEPPRDPKDTYFARVLAQAPDQLLSHNRPELLVSPDEPALSIDAEPVRVVASGDSNDDAGLDAMQPMERSTSTGDDAGRFWLLPLPPGLHAESPELFGFFTIEVRLGHHRYHVATAGHAEGEAAWTTAQGRFGRPLRVPGVQYPAPTLTCIVARDGEKLSVAAPYAVAVHEGRDVTADPPRTELWALLYAQVRQADGRAFRNVLLDDQVLDVNLRVEHDRTAVWSQRYTASERAVLAAATSRNLRDDSATTATRNLYKLADSDTVGRDATRYGTTLWSDEQVTRLLALYGLPKQASLSVVCVETYPHITNVRQHVSAVHDPAVRDGLRSMVGGGADQVATVAAGRAPPAEQPRPLAGQLGEYRILRTSPLTKVPDVC